MRVNIYAEELTDRVEIISKTTEAGTFTGLRFYLELPISVPVNGGHNITHRGPFIHRPGDDDDSSAVTFWGKSGMRALLRKALAELDKHYAGGAKAYVQTSNQDKTSNQFIGDTPANICKHGYARNECPVSEKHPCF